MSWNEISHGIIGQGPVFWAAAAAIATGLTLLVVSIVMQMRRTLIRPAGGTRRVRWRNPLKGRNPAAEPTPGTVQAAAAGYAAQTTPVATMDPRTDQTAETLALLLERLRAAAGHLSALQKAVESDANSASSVLKEPASDVEYVFRAGV